MTEGQSGAPFPGDRTYFLSILRGCSVTEMNHRTLQLVDSVTFFVFNFHLFYVPVASGTLFRA